MTTINGGNPTPLMNVLNAPEPKMSVVEDVGRALAQMNQSSTAMMGRIVAASAVQTPAALPVTSKAPPPPAASQAAGINVAALAGIIGTIAAVASTSDSKANAKAPRS